MLAESANLSLVPPTKAGKARQVLPNALPLGCPAGRSGCPETQLSGLTARLRQLGLPWALGVTPLPACWPAALAAAARLRSLAGVKIDKEEPQGPA